MCHIDAPIICEECGYEHGSCRCNWADEEWAEEQIAHAEATDGLINAWEMAGLI